MTSVNEPIAPQNVALKDGTTLLVRPVTPDDAHRLVEFARSLSPETRYLRFFGSGSDAVLVEKVKGWAKAPTDDQVGMVAIAGGDGRIVGHGMYTVDAPGVGECAFVVADEWRGRGVGTALLDLLAGIAAERGVHTLQAVVMPENSGMLRVFRDSGFLPTIVPRAGEIEVSFPTEISEQGQEARDQRVATAAVSAIRHFFEAGSVAVIGASRHRGTIGGEVFHNLLDFGFHGAVIPVNPKAPVVQGVLAFPDVESIPTAIDLAVIVVPAAHVLEMAEACGRKGVRGLVVISAGFAEVGDAGRERQNQLMEICLRWGMRLVGPNCMGILTTHPDVRLNATFAPHPPPAGKVGFMSQSGALGLAVMDYADALGLGLSSFVSVGNKADISGNDLIQFWEQDPATDVVLLYLESFGNPRNFSRIARRVGRRKPIIAVKSGRSTAGARATGSHTGALLAASDVTVDALFRQAGVIRTDTLQEMFDVAALLSSQPPPAGRRVAILTNAGGPGILCADACEAEGLDVPDLDETTRDRLKDLLVPEASLRNPIDMVASATAEQYRQAIGIVAADPNVDAVIVIFVPPLVTDAGEAARAVVDGVRSVGGAKPILSVFMQSEGVPPELRDAEVHVPSFAFPENAAIALARVSRYGEWRERPPETLPGFDEVRREEAAGIVAAALGRDDEGWLEPDEVHRLLLCYGLPVPAQRIAATPDDAAQAAAEIGGSVALKAIAPGLVHKTDAGAVRLGLDAARVGEEARAMADRLRGAGHPPEQFLVQAMAGEGTEMLVGVVHDRHFGPVVACGAGGTLTEILQDVEVRLTPIGDRDAREMIDGLRIRPLLSGYRGQPPGDITALVDVITRTSALIEDLPQIEELDLNPVIVHEEGVSIPDARIRVGTGGRPAPTTTSP